MGLFEADLRTWADDWQLAGQAERTIVEYVDCVRKFHAWCAEEGVQTPPLCGLPRATWYSSSTTADGRRS